MSTKHDLNRFPFFTAVLVAGLVGWVTGSMAVSRIALAAVPVAGYDAGDIRR